MSYRQLGPANEIGKTSGMDANLRLTRSQVLLSVLIVLGLATGGFLSGWHLSRRSIGFGSPAHNLSYKGDAKELVRAAVLVSLKEFQAGYAKRDPAMLPAFMEQLFAKDRDILLLGTDSGEWIEGYQRVGSFIANDWRYWGDVRLDVDNAMISADNDVAWVTTVGTVGTSPSSTRAIRFAAVLTRSGDRWLFRHIQFQWEDRPESLAELLRGSIRGGSPALRGSD